MRACDFPEFETSLYNYIMQSIHLMNNVSIFGEDVIKKLAIETRDEILARMEISDDLNKAKKYKEFKASTGWYYGFLKRKKPSSYRPRGDAALLSASDIEEAQRDQIAKNCLFDISEIANTDEVGVLYRSFPSRSVNPIDKKHRPHLQRTD